MSLALKGTIHSSARHSLVKVDEVAVELGAVNAGKLCLSADSKTAAAAHTCSVDHDRVHGSNCGYLVLLCELTYELHHDERVVLAAYCGGVLAGLFAGFTASDTGEVLTLAVETSFRRKGIARKLLDAFFALVPAETETIALEVRCSNCAAISLYESFGFKKAGVRRRFYHDPIEDADIMVKSL